MMSKTLPELFLKRLNQIVPDQDTETFFKAKLFKTFRVNLLKVQTGYVQSALKDQSIPFEVCPWYAPAIIVPSAFEEQILASPLISQGQLYAQGLESMQPVIVLDPQPGEAVLDLCAAPGGKTTQMAAYMRNEGTLLANEPVRKRFYRLKSVVDLLQAKVRLTMADGRYLRHQEMFDRILVDAPCSSEGRFLEDDPKTYAYWSLRKIHEMAHKQKGLLLNAGRLLKPGGVLVYSTCTFAPEENEAVVDWFLRKTTGEFKLAERMRVLPDERRAGFFIAKLIRP